MMSNKINLPCEKINKAADVLAAPCEKINKAADCEINKFATFKISSRFHLKLKTLAAVLCAAVLCAVPAFSQPQADDAPQEQNEPREWNAPDENEDALPDLPDGDFLDLDFLNDGTGAGAIDPSLQKSFVIVDSTHDYDLNPHTASYSSESQILISLYEGLFSYNPATLMPEEALAESYRISRDKKRWTFTIREGAKFSDGSPVTAGDVREAWLDLLATPNAPYASMLDIITGAREYRTGRGSRDDVGIAAADDGTLVVRLASPASYFSSVLCHSAFAVCKKDLSVFSGPYVIESRRGGELTLAKNNNYWDAQNTHLEKISVVQSDDYDENSHQFNVGNADWISGGASVQRLIDRNAAQINAEFATEYLFFKRREQSVWNNAEFRLALLEAVPWEQLRGQNFVEATTLVYPINGYPRVEGFSYTDANEAASLMKAARANANIPQGETLALVFAIPESDYMREQADLLAEAWRPLGVELLVEVESSARYLGRIASWDADLFSYTWIGDFADPLAFLELFRADSTLNVAQWANAGFDDLLLEAALYTDSERMRLLARAEQMLLDDGIVLPISHPVSLNIIDLDATGGWYANAFDIHPFKYMYRKQKTTDLPNLVMR